MTILVTGVRGRIGRRVADQLRARGLDVRAASADPATVPGAAYPVVPADLVNGDGLDAALRDVDQVFLYAPHEHAEQTAERISAAGVRHVVLLSSASVEDDGSDQISRFHHDAEDAMRATGVRTTFLRPNAFATNTLAWAGAVREGAVSLPHPDAYVEPIHEADIADSAVAVLTDDATTNRSFFLTGGESLTQREQVAILAGALGRHVAVVELTPDEWRRQVAAFMPEVVADALLDLWQRSVGAPGRVDGTVRDVTGQEPRSFAQWADDNVDAFR